MRSTAFADIAEQHSRRTAENTEWPPENQRDASAFIGSSFYTIAEYESRRHAGNAGIGERGLLYLTEDLHKRSGNRQILSLATACTSSAYALIQADNYLYDGTERVFVLSVENPNHLTPPRFHSLGLFTERYRSFGGNGLVLGKSVVALALSATPSDCTGRLELTGHAANTGSGLVRSNSKALEQAIRRVLNATAVLLESAATVKTHGIGTADSDTAELTALENVLGALPPLVALKV